MLILSMYGICDNLPCREFVSNLVIPIRKFTITNCRDKSILSFSVALCVCAVYLTLLYMRSDQPVNTDHVYLHIEYQ